MNVASYRYRIDSPATFLPGEMIFPKVSNKADARSSVCIFSKHWAYSDQNYAKFCKLRGQKIIFDICDDHFSDKYGFHYKAMCEIADLIVCNSFEMQRVIEGFGFDATVISDPVTVPQQPYEKKPARMVWYGGIKNIDGLFEVYTPDISIPLEIIVPGNIDPPEHLKAPQVSWTRWHKKVIENTAKRNSIALLPYRLPSQAKSANRVLEALWSGMVVFTDKLPAVEDLNGSGILYLDDGATLQELVEAYEGQDWTEEIQTAQDEINEKYSGPAIAEKWAEAIRSIA
jgi:hypothetical protein